MMMIRFLVSTALITGLSGGVISTAQDKIAPANVIEHTHVHTHTSPKIQIALLLDTSNSMDGLIAQTKSQLWMLVNELAEGEKDGKAPEIELALYEYGNSNLSIGKGYIRQVVSLTTDLDDVSEKLFALSTNGGQEYAGQVITAAVDELEWSGEADDMKLIIIAGNEAFTQGPVSFQSACRRARQKGVVIDTIHCGDEQIGINTKWKAGADCGGGVYMTINQDAESVYVASPYDKDILELNDQLNATYIGYGDKGRAFKARQEVQDDNASKMGLMSSISRAKSKASAQYKNESWDMVDAYEADEARILALPESDLPSDMKGMSVEARKAHITALKNKREDIRAQIDALQAKQKVFVTAEKANMAKTMTMDEIVVSAVRNQAKKNGFTFED